MKDKLTEKELKDRLEIVNKEKSELDEELFFIKYSNLTFFQLFKRATNWKLNIILTIIFWVSVSIINYHILIYYIIGIPLLLLLVSLSNILEVYQRISIIKKKRK